MPAQPYRGSHPCGVSDRRKNGGEGRTGQTASPLISPWREMREDRFGCRHGGARAPGRGAPSPEHVTPCSSRRRVRRPSLPRRHRWYPKPVRMKRGVEMDRQHRNLGKVCAECRRLPPPSPVGSHHKHGFSASRARRGRGWRPSPRLLRTCRRRPHRTAAAGCPAVGDSRPPSGRRPRQPRRPPPWLDVDSPTRIRIWPDSLWSLRTASLVTRVSVRWGIAVLAVLAMLARRSV
jgi:hypothetical protein